MWRNSRRPVFAIVLAFAVAGCGVAERLTFVRPSTGSREYTQVAPRYDVRGSKRGPDPGDLAMQLAAATMLFQRGELDDAESLARAALKSSPQSGDAITLLGLVANERGDAAAAGRFYRAAASAAPAKGVYANNYGTWLCANGHAVESLAWFDRALADPEYSTPLAALSNAGSCAWRAGQPQRAESRWRTVLAAQPTHVPALAGMARMQFERGEHLEARAFAERWLAQAPEDADGLRLAAEIERKLGDNAAASRYLSRLQGIPSASTTSPPAR